MDDVTVDDLSAGVVRLDQDERIVDASSWFREWIGEDPLGRELDDLLAVAPDFLDDAGLHSTMMVSVREPDRAVLAVRRATSTGSILTMIDATDRYEAGRRLRTSYALADRTRNRLQLIIDASIAFSAATDEERLADILAATAARAYGAEEAAVYLFGRDGRLSRAAGSNPLDILLPDHEIAAGVRQLRGVLKVDADAEGEPISRALVEAMRRAGAHALIAAPLTFEGTTFGIVACFFRHARGFDDEAAPLAEALAGQAARALSAVRLQRQLEHAAMHDETTNLPNRRRLDLIARGVDHAHASVVFIDLDGFKDVNDRLGHEVGDEVLREVARRLQDNVRDVDVVARYGGDEFVVVCDADPQSALEIADRVRHALSREFPFLPDGLQLSASVGVATADVRHGVLGIDRLIRDADQAMYLAKGRGGNQVAVAGLAVA